MSFNSNIPLITDPILQSQRQLKANFKAINSAFSTNHAALTRSPDVAGMHNMLTLRPQTMDPATSSTQVALYNKIVSSVPEMFFRPSGSATTIQLTYPSIKSDSSTTQYTFIAGPFIVYGGVVSNPTNGQTVTLSPGSSLKYVDLIMANATENVSTTSVIPTSIAGTSFNISYGSTVVNEFDVYYFAIGV